MKLFLLGEDRFLKFLFKRGRNGEFCHWSIKRWKVSAESMLILLDFNGISLVKIPIYCMWQVPGGILTV